MATDHLIHADDVRLIYDGERCFLARQDGTYFSREEMREIAQKLIGTAMMYGSAIEIHNKKMPMKERR